MFGCSDDLLANLKILSRGNCQWTLKDYYEGFEIGWVCANSIHDIIRVNEVTTFVTGSTYQGGSIEHDSLAIT